MDLRPPLAYPTANTSTTAPSNSATAAPRRLVLLFDGTWNRREDTTNVWRLRMMLRHALDQIVYYDEGVGTTAISKIPGGAFGSGLSRKVLNGYCG